MESCLIGDINMDMLLKKYKIIKNTIVFKRSRFSNGMCLECVNNPYCDIEELILCRKANSNGLLYDPEFKHAYIKKDRKD